MRKLLPILVGAVAVCILPAFVHAFETDFDDLKRFDRSLPAWKFGRGVVNVLSGPQEVIANMTNSAIDGHYYGAYSEGMYGSVAGAVNGYISGFAVGLVKGMRRMTTGAVEMLTFWKPEYGPTIDPTYGTRCKAWGEGDYFSPEPFWYTGPWR